jgi:hypothetical protein
MVISNFDLVKRYPELSHDQRVCVRNWLQDVRYADLVRLLADPDARTGLDRAYADRRQLQKHPEAAVVAFSVLTLMAGVVVLSSVLK